MSKKKLNENDFEDGVYFEMLEEDYHKIPRLSSSGIKKLLISPMDFWATSFLNPDAEQYTSKALDQGSAFHARMLEGPQVFRNRYIPELEVKEGWLVSGNDLKAKCKELELKASGTKTELTARILEADKSVKIYDDQLAKYQAKTPKADVIDKKLFAQTQHAAELLDGNTELNHFFKNGCSEVSVLWTCPDTGVPMKARFDYLTATGVEDLKTFSNSLGKPLNNCISQSMANYKYNIQAVLYLEAFNQLNSLVWHDLDPEKEFSIDDDVSPTFKFLFQQTGAAPVARGFTFNTTGLAFVEGARNVRRAKQTFQGCWEQFGTDEWYDNVPMVDMDDEFFPIWMFD